MASDAIRPGQPGSDGGAMIGVQSPPRLLVELRGAPIGGEASRTLASVRVQQRLSLPTLCELTFVGEPAPIDAGVVGASLRLRVRERDTALFSGQVTAIEYVHGPDGEGQVVLRGYDVLHRLRKEHETRVHVQASLDSIARQMASPLQLGVASSVETPVWRSIIQPGQSNLDFLAYLCDRAGLYFTLREDEIRIVTLAGTGEALPLRLGESLLEARVELNADVAVGSFTATGWNPLEVRDFTGRAASGRVGSRSRARISSSDVGGEEERRLVGRTVETARQAELLAQSELDRHNARVAVFWGVADGDTRLRPSTAIDVTGIAEGVEGRYVLTSVTHTVDSHRGFISELSSMPPPPRVVEVGVTSTFGVVTRVDDPDQLGRVKVTLPAYEGVETDWLQVLAVGGGKGKGLLIIPDVDDEVLLLFDRSDPASGVVIGGLFGMGGSPDSGVDDGSVRRFALRTAGGQVIRFDDANDSIRLENSDGSYFELSPESVRIHSERDLEIEAPGRSIVVRAQSINFERG